MHCVPLTDDGLPIEPWRADRRPDTTPADWGRVNAYGVVTGEHGIVVIDLDRKSGVDGVAEMADLGYDIDDLETLQADTPSGGVHVYVRWPADMPMARTTAGDVAPGVDIRGQGGMARGIGSTTARGVYAVRRSALIAECPCGLAQLILDRTEQKKSMPEPRSKSFRRPKSHRAGRAGLAGLVQRMLDAEPGTQHDTLLSTGTSAAMYYGMAGLRAIRIAAQQIGWDDDADTETHLMWCARYAEMDDPVMAAEDAMNDEEDDDDDE